MVKIVPYLKFAGNCAEAMNFYNDAIAGELTLTKIGDTPMAAGMPPETHNSILHSVIVKDGVNVLFASEHTDPEEVVSGKSISICLSCKYEEAADIFAKLSAGGNVEHPLKDEFFGQFGDFTDKYGMHWMVQSDPKE